jgi:hypothetical protein
MLDTIYRSESRRREEYIALCVIGRVKAEKVEEGVISSNRVRLDSNFTRYVRT